MGIKFLSLHMIPWCFHLRVLESNNVLSCSLLQQQKKKKQQLQAAADHDHQESSSCSIKLIKLDGVVKIYHPPIHVSQLMLEYPKHLVCHSESFYIGQKIPPLSEQDELQPGHNYFLLPKHFFQSVLSFVTINASFASTTRKSPSSYSSNSIINSSSPSCSSSSSSSSSSNQQQTTILKKKAALAAAAASCQPLFDIQRTPSGSLQIRVSDEFISKLMTEEGNENDENNAKSGVCTTPQLQKDYTQLVGCRQWKPKLETIRESAERRKLSDSFGMKRRRKKKKSQSQSQSQSLSQSKSRLRGGGWSQNQKSGILLEEEEHPRTILTTNTPKKMFKLRVN